MGTEALPGGGDDEAELARIEDALGRLSDLLDRGMCWPADLEYFLAAVLGREADVPLGSLPGEDVFRQGCAGYQKDRPSHATTAPPAMSVAEKIAWYRAGAERILARQGMDLCWEMDGLFAPHPELSHREEERSKLSECSRLALCDRFRIRLYATAHGRSEDRSTGGGNAEFSP